MTIIVRSIASASARDYDWLKASIAAWLHRDDLDHMIPDFVMLAEKRLNGDLEARLANSTATLTTFPGETDIELPSDYATMRSLSLPGYGPLTYVPVTQFDMPESARARAPRAYTIVGRSIRLSTAPDKAYPLNLTYQGGVPALADSGGVNWLIEQRPDVYLAASMCEAQSWARNTVEQQKWEGKYAIAMALLNKKNEWDDASTLAMPAPA